jgi:hypothetical protein
VKGRWASEWSALLDYDIKNNNSGIKYNSPQKIAKEIIMMTWDCIYNCWLTRNEVEHDNNGDSEFRKKEKIIEKIIGESEKTKYRVYSKSELERDKLLQSPLENLQMIITNIKNEKESRKKRRNKIVHPK